MIHTRIVARYDVAHAVTIKGQLFYILYHCKGALSLYVVMCVCMYVCVCVCVPTSTWWAW